MQTLRFGRKLKLPSTIAIKHQILTLMLQDHLKAQGFESDPAEAPTHSSADKPSNRPYSGFLVLSKPSAFGPILLQSHRVEAVELKYATIESGE